ncbi:MAG: thioredoxin family protein [Hydrogeniiclostridium mannosilyticum]
MSLFGKKKEEKYCCGGNCNAQTMQAAEKSKSGGTSVKILGSGCAKCNQLKTNTLAALQQLGMDTAIDHITDFTQIAAYGVMTTPALVVDGKVVSFGKVLKTDEVIAILKKVRESYGV